LIGGGKKKLKHPILRKMVACGGDGFYENPKPTHMTSVGGGQGERPRARDRRVIGPSLKNRKDSNERQGSSRVWTGSESYLVWGVGGRGGGARVPNGNQAHTRGKRKGKRKGWGAKKKTRLRIGKRKGSITERSNQQGQGNVRGKSWATYT